MSAYPSFVVFSLMHIGHIIDTWKLSPGRRFKWLFCLRWNSCSRVCVWRIGVINTLANESTTFSSLGNDQASRCQGRWLDTRAEQFQHCYIHLTYLNLKTYLRPIQFSENESKFNRIVFKNHTEFSIYFLLVFPLKIVEDTFIMPQIERPRPSESCSALRYISNRQHYILSPKYWRIVSGTC